MAKSNDVKAMSDTGLSLAPAARASATPPRHALLKSTPKTARANIEALPNGGRYHFSSIVVDLSHFADSLHAAIIAISVIMTR